MKSGFRATSLLLILLFAVPASSSRADTLVKTNEGREFAGEVIDVGVNTLTMKLEESGYQIVPVKSISSIKVDVKDGGPIEGTLIDWSKTELVVRVGDRDVAIRDGEITAVFAVDVATGGPIGAAEDEAPSSTESAPVDPSTPTIAPSNATM